MKNFMRILFGKKRSPKDMTGDEFRAWYDHRIERTQMEINHSSVWLMPAGV